MTDSNHVEFDLSLCASVRLCSDEDGCIWPPFFLRGNEFQPQHQLLGEMPCFGAEVPHYSQMKVPLSDIDVILCKV